MANNVMWIVHRPSGCRFKLAKRMGSGWYVQPRNHDLKEALNEFFDIIECGHWDTMDDLYLDLDAERVAALEGK